MRPYRLEDVHGVPASGVVDQQVGANQPSKARADHSYFFALSISFHGGQGWRQLWQSLLVVGGYPGSEGWYRYDVQTATAPYQIRYHI